MFTALREEDGSWDYRGEFTKQLTHGFHSYPAMMIPQVARRLIETYSRPGDTVLDPFCGSGSVLVESMALGRNSWGVDLNPVALLLARVKTTPLDPNDLHYAYMQLLDRMDSLRDNDLETPDFFNIDFWFKPATVLQLARIKAAIEDVLGPADRAVREFFLVPFSETARLASNTRSHEFKLFRYAEVELASHNPDAFAIFREKTERNIDRMWDFYLACQNQPANPWCRTILADSTHPVPAVTQGSVDVMVTSPPYGDSQTTVAYGQFSRLSAQWLGFSDRQARALDSNLMGGRMMKSAAEPAPSPSLEAIAGRIAPASEQRARQVLGFYSDLYRALTCQARAIRPGGYLCTVIGNRRVKKVQLPTDVIIAEMGAAIGLKPVRIIVRNIPSKTMPLRNSPTNVPGELEQTMHKEYIVVLRKPISSYP